jgi:hypothetical protein
VQLALVGIAFLIAFWWIRRGKPQRLEEWPPAPIFALHHGQVITAAPEAQTGVFTIRTRPVAGGASRVIGQVAGSSLEIVTVTDSDLFFVVTIGSAPSPPLGAALLSSSAQTPAQKPSRSLRRLSLAGGKPEAIAGLPDPLPGIVQRFLSGGGQAVYTESPVSLAIVDGSVYWVDPRPNLHAEKSVVTSQGTTKSRLEKPESVLKIVPLSGGSARSLMTGLLASTAFYPGDGGVYWTQFKDVNDYDLFFIREKDTKPSVLHHMSSTPPQMTEGRFYWVAYPPKGTPTGIMSVNPDGSGMREVLSFSAQGGASTHRGLRAYRDKLYWLQDTRADGARSVRAKPRYTLCLLDPQHNTALQKLGELSPASSYSAYQHSYSAAYRSSPGADFFIDDGYCYYCQEEQQERLLQLDSPIVIKNFLARFRLPDR